MPVPNPPLHSKKEERILKGKKGKTIIILAILVVFVIAIFCLKDYFFKRLYPKIYKDVVMEMQEKYDVEESLIFAVIKAESNFEENAISRRNAIGLMQIMEETARDVAKKNKIQLSSDNTKQELLDGSKNIEIGTCYLATLLERYGNKEVALAAYNAGIGTVDRLDSKRDY